MKRYVASTVAAALLSIPMTFFSTGAAAQKAPLRMPPITMPSTGYNPYAWMTHLNNVGNRNVANIFKSCMSHPGACKGLASQQSLNDAIQRVQKQSLLNSGRQQLNQDIQTHSINQTNCAVTGGTVYWNRNTQQKECSH